MTLEYKILWIDNDDSIYRNHQEDIEEHLTNLGFTPIIEKGKSYESFNKFESILNEFDLFILDYKLDKVKDSNGKERIINGNEIIKNIREDKSIYTDVIFYSGVPDDMRKQAYDDKLSGVYFTSRAFDDFEDDVLGLIDVTIKKVQDINNLRGLIMAEVAELDIIKEEIIHLASEKLDEKKLEKYTLNKIKSSGTSSKNQAQRYLEDIENITFSSLFSKIGFVDSNKKAMAIGEALDKLNITEPICKDTFTQPYIDSILTKRNKFAHVKECDGVDENGIKCKVIGNIPFTRENCIKIRHEIKKYKDILEKIKISL